ncbi:MAG TPA: NFACT RNA binding domain-containing protein, partial [Candidatus Thermoplasmatota archaeon]|nr:NFACT RNA binding domain-containing protein [Candidatus Thermoplasmatota archaeon]
AAREEGRPEALVVESVLPKEAVAVLALPDASGAIRKVRVDFRKNLQENAQDQYDRAKKFRDKQVGARKALARSEAWLKDLGTKGARLEAKAVEKKDAPKASRRFWFDAFRWFRTSDGFFVVGGRDAGSNEKLVKKHLEENDRYVHADLHGAPSVVVKSAGRDIPESAIEEACAFAVGMSKAWGAGHAAGEAYWVLPSQVSKTPNPGEYVARGAFIVRGKRNYRTVSVRLAVGEVFLDPRVGEDAPGRRPGAIEVEGARKMMGGPDRAVAGQAKRYVVLEPGDEAANALAPRLAKAFGVPTEEIQAVLPPGGSRVVEVHGVELP